MARPSPGRYARWFGFLLVGALLVGSLAYASSFPTNVLNARVAGPNFPGPIRHVVTIVMENNNVNTTRSQGAYFSRLANSYGFLSRYYAVCHPSAPNYLAMTTGEALQCGSDGVRQYSVSNVVDLLNAAGETWKGYFESMPAPCDASDSGLYVAHHNPFVYFSDISAATCRSHDVGFGGLWADVNSTSFPNYAWISPNMHDDCHSAPVSYCDGWLGHFLPELMSKPWAASTVFLVTFDESFVNGADQDTGYRGLSGGNVYFVAACASYCPHRALTTLASHYDYLTTVEWLLGLGSLGRNDDPALFPALTGLFAFGSSTNTTASLSAPAIAAAPQNVSVNGSAQLSTTSGFAGGTAPYRCQWLESSPTSGAFAPLGSDFACSPSSNASVSTGALADAGVYSFALAVTDSASPARTVQSAPANVTVGNVSSFSPPLVWATSTSVNSGQATTLYVTRPFQGGVGPYTCQWRVWAPGGDADPLGAPISPCPAATPVSTGTLGTPGAWVFDLRVQDSASSNATVYSNNVTVVVNGGSDLPAAGPAGHAPAPTTSVASAQPAYTEHPWAAMATALGLGSPGRPAQFAVTIPIGGGRFAE